MLRKISLLAICFFGIINLSSAQNFGGIIEFKKQTGTTVVNYVYYVKGDKVRIDEFTPNSRVISGSMIIDTKAGTMQYMDPVLKIYGTRVSKGLAAAAAGSIATTTKATKDILGYKCTEQVVRNENDSTEISYFLASGKFDFFTPMMKVINRQEKTSTYFFSLTIKDGTMPFLAVEKDLKGNEIGRLEVTRLEEKEIADGMFTIPKEYVEAK